MNLIFGVPISYLFKMKTWTCAFKHSPFHHWRELNFFKCQNYCTKCGLAFKVDNPAMFF